MLTRVIAALALVPLFIFIVIGGIPLYIAEIVILAMALREFYKAFNAINIHPIENIGYIFIAYMGLKNILNLGVEYTYIMIFLLFMYSITYLLRCKNNVIDIAITFFSIFYVAISIDFIVLTINSFERGAIYVWTIFIVAFLTDTFAYFTGYLFGKHKLIPKVSPKKTVEGSIGGIMGFFGDLVASSIKRYVGIKDYSNLIPGHGGVLDRFDSILFNAVVVFYYLTFIVGI